MNAYYWMVIGIFVCLILLGALNLLVYYKVRIVYTTPPRKEK